MLLENTFFSLNAKPVLLIVAILDNCLWLSPTNIPGQRFFAWGKLLVRSNEEELCDRSLGEPPNGLNNDNSLGTRFQMSSISRSAPSDHCQAAGFHCECGLFVFKATSELGKWVWKLGNVSLQRFSYFSWIDSSICCKSLDDFQKQEKDESDNFPSGLIALKKEFWRFLPCHSCLHCVSVIYTFI